MKEKEIRSFVKDDLESFIDGDSEKEEDLEQNSE